VIFGVFIFRKYFITNEKSSFQTSSSEILQWNDQPLAESNNEMTVVTEHAEILEHTHQGEGYTMKSIYSETNDDITCSIPEC
jgi:hypothetical protein